MRPDSDCFRSTLNTSLKVMLKFTNFVTSIVQHAKCNPWRIQDFAEEEVPTLKVAVQDYHFGQFFLKRCLKMKPLSLDP